MTSGGHLLSTQLTNTQSFNVHHHVVCLMTGPSLLTTGLQPPYGRSTASLRQVQASLRQVHSVLTTGPQPLYDRSTASLQQVHSLLTTGPSLPTTGPQLPYMSTASLQQVHSLLKTGPSLPTTGPQPLPNPVLREGQSRASSFSLHYLLGP